MFVGDGDDKKYSNNNHKSIEEIRFLVDNILFETYSKMPKGKIEFVSITKEKGKVVFIYHPPLDAIPTCVKWINISCIEGKNKLYEKASGGIHVWYFKGITGNIKQFLMTRLRNKWFSTGDYRSKIEEFTKDVAYIMRNYIPYEFDVYSKYIEVFFAMFNTFENDKAIRFNVLKSLTLNLRYVIFSEKTDGFEEIYKKLIIGSTRFKISKCSTDCMNLMKKLDFEHDKAANFLGSIINDGESFILERENQIRLLNEDNEDNDDNHIDEENIDQDELIIEKSEDSLSNEKSIIQDEDKPQDEKIDKKRKRIEVLSIDEIDAINDTDISNDEKVVKKMKIDTTTTTN